MQERLNNIGCQMSDDRFRGWKSEDRSWKWKASAPAGPFLKTENGKCSASGTECL
ncbi:MAG: hypothetical protein V2A54_03630 [Bacteroidota bacterium]